VRRFHLQKLELFIFILESAIGSFISKKPGFHLCPPNKTRMNISEAIGRPDGESLYNNTHAERDEGKEVVAQPYYCTIFVRL